MALVSPGVEVSVVDESFYTPADGGTIPCIFIATAANKPNGSGTGIAAGTLATNAETPYLITSQRDLVDTFGDPIFKVDTSNNPIHGGELNEYGLNAAYSYLGIANRAYVLRANLDLSQLEASATAPGADPIDGDFWLDTSISRYGVAEWNGSSLITGGQIFESKETIIITDETLLDEAASLQTNGSDLPAPNKTVGGVGSYAVVATTTLHRIYYRNKSGNWVLVGSDAWIKSWPVVTGDVVYTANPANATEDLTIAGGTVSIPAGSDLDAVVLAINTVFVAGNIFAANEDGRLAIYSDGTDGLGNNIDSVAITGTNNTYDIMAQLGIGSNQSAVYYVPKLNVSTHTQIPEFKATGSEPRPTGSVWLKTTFPNLGMNIVVTKYNEVLATWEPVDVPIYKSNEEALYSLDRTGGGKNLLAGTVYGLIDVAGDLRPTATLKLFSRNGVGTTAITGQRIIAGSFTTGGPLTFDLSSTDATVANFSVPVTVSFTPQGQESDSLLMAGAINDANVPNVSASVDDQNRLVVFHSQGGDIRINDNDNAWAEAGFSAYVDSNNGTVNLYLQQGTSDPSRLQASYWKTMNYTASDVEPIGPTADGQLWYSSIVDQVDILIHNGDAFVGYQYDGTSGLSTVPSPYYSAVAGSKTDPAGPIVSATVPLLQTDQTELVTGDLWIDTSVIDEYLKIYKYNGLRTDLPIKKRWFAIDTTDQTTEDGVLFADARFNTAGANSDKPGDIEDLLLSDYVDPDSPDPALYPKGMLLVNLRRSGFNVKQYVENAIDTAEKNIRYGNESMSAYVEARWQTESGNRLDGAGTFGRHAQRKVVVQRLQAMVNNNEEIRDDESRVFNLMACPGYPELHNELINLNYDRGLSAFIVGDTPYRLQPNGTVLNNWGTNVNVVAEDGIDGVVTADPYIAMYYPSGYTSDNFGNNVVVPSSHMMLRTLALSDQVSYPWFAPAGVSRGNITNASSTGYITAEGEFKPIALNEGLRDTLYSNNINPITFVTGAGLMAYGQKTRQLTASALDRINVVRMIIFLRRQLKIATKPYLFEPNDAQTRDQVITGVEAILLDLVATRAIYDYIVVCDSSNNTPARIDRGELYIDVAVEPVKSIEFIYIPLRIKNTGEISG